MIRRLATVVLLSSLAACSAATADSPPRAPGPEPGRPSVSSEVEAAEAGALALEVRAYLDARQYLAVRSYLTVRAYLDANRPLPVSRPSGTVPEPEAPRVTGACGGATNGADRYIGRESGGDPGVYNSGGSGAWGCYQIMPGTWAGAGCDAFGAYGSATPAEQAECASRLPLSAWGG